MSDYPAASDQVPVGEVKGQRPVIIPSRPNCRKIHVLVYRSFLELAADRIDVPGALVSSQVYRDVPRLLRLMIKYTGFEFIDV